MKINDKVVQAVLWIVLICSLFIFVLPYIIMISNSFITFNYSLPYPPIIIPKVINLDAYKYVIGELDILKPFINSVKVAVLTTFFTIMLATLSAYGFARIKFAGREVLFKAYLFSLMIPGFLSIIPQFLILKHITLPGLSNGLISTHAGLILLYVSTMICGSTFFLKGFFESLPKELEESVVVDGGNHLTIFWKIMLPLSKPAIGTMAIFTLQGIWEDYFSARVILGSKEALVTLPLILVRLNGAHATRFEYIFAASILMQIPMILLFIFAQKKFVIGGLSEGAVKG